MRRRAMRPDQQRYDEVRIVTVPRFKQSDLSGDEWRISARIELIRKGQVVYEQSYRNVETACQALPYVVLMAGEEGSVRQANIEDLCDQEGCSKRAEICYRKVADYCLEGHKTDPQFGDEYRYFCREHAHRGDCGLDDADRNYDEVPLWLEQEGRG